MEIIGFKFGLPAFRFLQVAASSLPQLRRVEFIRTQKRPSGPLFAGRPHPAGPVHQPLTQSSGRIPAVSGTPLSANSGPWADEFSGGFVVFDRLKHFGTGFGAVAPAIDAHPFAGFEILVVGEDRKSVV